MIRIRNHEDHTDEALQPAGCSNGADRGQSWRKGK